MHSLSLTLTSKTVLNLLQRCMTEVDMSTVHKDVNSVSGFKWVDDRHINSFLEPVARHFETHHVFLSSFFYVVKN